MVVAVLSRNYLRSRCGRMEWQAALRADPENPSNKLVTIRLEDCPLDGLLATITYVDLVGVADPEQARALLLDRIGQALAGRAKPLDAAVVPHGPVDHPRPGAAPRAARRESSRTRRTPVAPPAYPAGAVDVRPARVAHAAARRRPPVRPGAGRARASRCTAGELQAEDLGGPDPAERRRRAPPRPDGGDRRPDRVGQPQGVRRGADLPHRAAGAARPGAAPAGRRARARGTSPRRRAGPTSATARPTTSARSRPTGPSGGTSPACSRSSTRGSTARIFDSAQPWTLFAVPELQVVVAGAELHHGDEPPRRRTTTACVGEAQAAWFAERLRPFEEAGWLRLGAVGTTRPAGRCHDPAAARRRHLRTPAGRPAQPAAARGGRGAPERSRRPCLPALGPGRHQLIELTAGGLRRWRPGRGDPPPVEATSAPLARAGADLRREQVAPALPPDARRPPSSPNGPRARPALLLDRIAEVCEARHDRARSGGGRRPAAPARHLPRGRRSSGSCRIGAHVGELTSGDVDAFAAAGARRGAGARRRAGLRGPAARRRRCATRRCGAGVRLRSFTEFQGLLDLRDYVAGQTARLRADRRYPPALYVPQRYRELDRPEQRGPGRTWPTS